MKRFAVLLALSPLVGHCADNPFIDGPAVANECGRVLGELAAGTANDEDKASAGGCVAYLMGVIDTMADDKNTCLPAEINPGDIAKGAITAGSGTYASLLVKSAHRLYPCKAPK